MTSPYDVNDVWRIVERIAKSSDKTINSGEQEMLTWLKNSLGARKELQEYAPRTRRRYRGATKVGKTVQEVNAEEYRNRQPSSGVPHKPNQRLRVYALIKRRNEFFPNDLVDIDDVEDYALALGWDNLERILTDQIDSCEHWLRNDPRIGRIRWFDRKHEKVRPDFGEYIANTDIFYFYHARRI